VLAVVLHEPVFKGGGDGGLSGAGATGHPESRALLGEGSVAGFRGEVTGILGSISCCCRAFDNVGGCGGQRFFTEFSH